MNVPEYPELEFEEAGHIYRLNGVEIPSVTTLMKPLSDAHYSAITPEVLAKAAAKGTAVHQAIENYVEFEAKDIAPAYDGYFEAFRRWLNDKEVTPLATERKVYHKALGYAGTSDLICLYRGAITLVDYKTTAQVNSMLCGVQLEGYQRAWESQGFEIEQKLILRLTYNGCYEERFFPKSTECWKVLTALMTIHNYKNKF